MDHHAFRGVWDDALRRAGLLSSHDRPEETIELADMSRRYAVRVGMFGGRPAAPEPFTASLELKWRWDALLSARTSTTEEDLLTELLGARRPERRSTARPWLRVDLEFAGTLPFGQPMRAPTSDTWRAWVAETMRSVDPLLPVANPRVGPEGLPIVEGWLGEPEAEAKVDPSGQLRLAGVTLRGWQAIQLPRQRSDAGRRPDGSPQEQLEPFAGRLRDSFDAWGLSLRLLLPTPPACDGEGRRLH